MLAQHLGRLRAGRGVAGPGPGLELATGRRIFPAALGEVRYGQLLRRLGHLTQAESVFESAIAHARRFKIAHDEERGWVGVARKEPAGGIGAS